MRLHHSRHSSLDTSLIDKQQHSTSSVLHPFAPTRASTPYRPPAFGPYDAEQTEGHAESGAGSAGLFSREARRRSRTQNSASSRSLSPHTELYRSEPFHEITHTDDERHDQAFEPIPASSSPSFSSHSRPSRPRSRSSSSFVSHTNPTSSESSDDSSSIPFSLTSDPSALFAPTSSLSRRKMHKLDRNFHREERKREEGGLRKVKAGMEIAMGVSRLYKEEKREKRMNGGGTMSGREGAGGPGNGFGAVEEMLKGMEKTIEGQGKEGTPGQTAQQPSNGKKDSINVEQLVAGAAGVAGVIGLAGMGWEWYRKHEREKRLQLGNELTRPASAPARSPTTEHPLDHSTSFSAVSASLHPIPPPINTLPPVPKSTREQPIFISHLTPSQHKTLQHAAAALLLKHHERHLNHQSQSRENGSGGNGKTYHYDEIGLIVGAVAGGWKEVTGLVEEGLRKVGAGRRSTRLFGVDLKELTKHEGVVSSHGIDPNAQGFRIPELLDHLITALKQSDMSISGILRESGNVRQILDIIHALDHSNGSNETVLDLAKLDPITLANLFTKFLGALPHPVLTHHLFGLFIATSHIQRPGLRRRAMHLVICLMPKVNRDVMECIFLFLSWLSKHAHLSVIDGKQMDLTGIANAMAPVLLSPKNRDPHPDELKSMIAAVLNLLEDQHILHEIPLELAHLLHIEPPPKPKDGSHDVAGFIKHLFDRL
ncbi:uncharacterized protein JCM6883_002133 [Sporobolomyces salmoneus]|uniref:uncharacterized protein n=1 Tax=Sporobolomyces salmoneus TaxID=183962 RepID=UPI00317E855F